MRFSIVVPVYNVEEYIQKCLDSVITQKFKDYEIIVVDDETPDNSMDIVDTYVQRYPNKVRVIHQKNRGLGGARNTGIKAAQGEYIVFLDSDDYIRSDMLEVLDQRLTKNPSDILMFNYIEVTPDGKSQKINNACGTEAVIFTIPDKRELMLLPPSACTKVFRRAFFIESQVEFPEKMLYEDCITRILMAKANKIQLCTESLYYYVQRTGSIMHSKVSERTLEIIKVWDQVYDRFVSDSLYDDYKDAIGASIINSVLCITDDINLRSRNHPYQKTLVEYIVEKCPAYQSNPFVTKSMRQRIDFLRNGEYQKYHYLCCVLDKVKEKLLQFPIISRLNDLRKGKNK